MTFGEVWNDNQRGINDDDFLGIGAEYFINENWSSQLNYLESKKISDLDYKGYLIGGRYYFNGGTGNSVFLSSDLARVGYLNDDENQLHLGAGLRLDLNQNFYLTAELKKVLSDSRYNRDAISLISFGYRFSKTEEPSNRADLKTGNHSELPVGKKEDINRIQDVDFKVVNKIKEVSFYFDFDSSVPLRVEKDKLNKMMENAIDDEANIVISGHTDDIGGKKYNKELSKDRAIFVKNKLKEDYDMDDSRFLVVAYGEESPIADNNTLDGQKKNRRVTVSIRK